jgi:NADH-quinone oxidoreductase subunit M
MAVACPADEAECRALLTTAYQQNHPVAVRYPRGSGAGVPVPTHLDPLPYGVGEVRRQGQGVALLVFGTLVLGWNYADANDGRWSFSLYELAQLGFEPGSVVATLVFFALFYGLGVRIPLFPLHGWLPSFMHHGNVAVAPIYLLGLKVGIYGLLRFVMPIVPHAVWEWHVIAVIFASTGVFYAAFLAMRERHLARANNIV